MLSKEVFKTEMERLKRFFCNWQLDISSKEVMQDWYSMFEELTDHQFKTAVKQYVKNENFNPSVSGITKHVNENIKKPTGNKKIVQMTQEEYEVLLNE